MRTERQRARAITRMGVIAMTTVILEVPSTIIYQAPKNGPRYTLDLSLWTQEQRNTLGYAMLVHSYGQKIPDTAGGADLTDAERHEKRQRVADNLQNGIWAERGGARLDPVLVEMRGLVVALKLMPGKVAAKATEAEIEAACGTKFAALKKRAESILALANAPLELEEPTIA